MDVFLLRMRRDFVRITNSLLHYLTKYSRKCQAWGINNVNQIQINVSGNKKTKLNDEERKKKNENKEK
jgi:hypothetical protein